MSLERYRRARLVVLPSSASVRAAARAMADNHVGAILVADHGELAGVVTDRDLALEIVGGSRPPTTPLRELVAEAPVTLPVSATVYDAIEAMRTHGCRRVPILEDNKPVGVVTLDDLLADRAIDLECARAIVVEQLEAPSRLKPEGAIHPEPPRSNGDGRARQALLRHEARAQSSYARLLRSVRTHAALADEEKAEAALHIVVGDLCRRVTADEARHFAGQLPMKVREQLWRRTDGVDRAVTRASIGTELATRLDLDDDTAAYLMESVGRAVSEALGAGVVAAFRDQLPHDMKDLLPVE